MRNLEWYIDRAVERSGASSDMQLSKMLGMGKNAVYFYKKKGIFPNDETMIKLAQIAGIDPYIALLDLNMWRSQGDAHITYKKLLEKITAAAIIAVLTVAFLMIPEDAHDHTVNAFMLLATAPGSAKQKPIYTLSHHYHGVSNPIPTSPPIYSRLFYLSSLLLSA